MQNNLPCNDSNACTTVDMKDGRCLPTFVNEVITAIKLTLKIKILFEILVNRFLKIANKKYTTLQNHSKERKDSNLVKNRRTQNAFLKQF